MAHFISHKYMKVDMIASINILILCLGGHTSEMLYMLNTLNMDKFKPRVYLITEGDTLSEDRLRDWEGQDNEEQASQIGYFIILSNRRIIYD
jgi:hypothetical protein